MICSRLYRILGVWGSVTFSGLYVSGNLVILFWREV